MASEHIVVHGLYSIISSTYILMIPFIYSFQVVKISFGGPFLHLDVVSFIHSLSSFHLNSAIQRAYT